MKDKKLTKQQELEKKEILERISNIGKQDPLIQHNISLYESLYSTKAFDIIDYKELKDYFFEDKPKDKRTGFNFDTILYDDGDRINENFSTSPWIVIDVDFKDNSTTNIKDLYHFFENDKYCYICGYSASGKGLRAIYAAAGINLYLIQLQLLDEEQLIEEKAKQEWKYEGIIRYLENNGFGDAKHFVDKALFRGAQMTFSLSSTLPHKIKDEVIPIDFTDIRIKNRSVVKHKNVSKKEISGWDLQQLFGEVDATTTIISYEDGLKFCSALQPIKNTTIRQFFWRWLKRNYDKSSKKSYRIYDNFNKFNHYIDNLNLKYNINLKILLGNYGIYIKNKSKKKILLKEHDIFDREYDKIIEYDDYIGETEFDFDDYKQDIVIKADAGAGKTTLVLNFFSNIYGVKIFAAPTKVLCDQVYDKKKKYKMKFCKYYDKEYEIDDNCIIVTTYASMSKLRNELKMEDLTVKWFAIDEVHKVVDYSWFNKNQVLFPDADRNIFLSATPEPFLMGDKDYDYIYFKRKDKKKKKINIVRYENVESVLISIFNSIRMKKEDRHLIYLNNKQYNNIIKKALKDKYDIDFELIDSKNKTDTYKYLIENEELNANAIVTSLINDGINILNKKWDYVWIIDNHTQSVFDIYQFVSRFRNAEPEIFYCFSGISKKSDDFKYNHIYFDTQYKNMKLVKEADIKKILEFEGKVKYDNRDYGIDSVYFEENEYKINKNQLKQIIYKNWSIHIRSSLKMFKENLSVFFDISLLYMDINFKPERKKENDIRLFVINNHEMLYNYYFKNISLRFNNDEMKFLNLNNKKIKKYMKRYHKIKMRNGDPLMFNLFGRGFKDEFNGFLDKLNEEQILRSKIEEAMYFSNVNVKQILDIDMVYEDFISKYKQIDKDLLSDYKINIENVRKTNVSLRRYGVYFKRTQTKKNGKRVNYYKLKNKVKK